METRYKVPAVKRAFDIIEALGRHSGGLTITEVYRALKLPLSSTAAIVYTLQDLGYIERSEGQRYRLSAKLLGLAGQTVERQDLTATCRPLLAEVVRETGLTGHLAVLRDCDSIYVDKVPSSSFVQISTYVGLSWPAHTSAVGKAMLAFLPVEDLRARIKRMSFKKLTPHTITSAQMLERQLEMFRQLGYSWELNEGEEGLGCVAAPVFGADGQVRAGISLGGTTHKITSATIPTLGIAVRRTADRMSALLGARME